MKKILFILFVGLSSGWVCAQEPVTVKNLGVNTFGSQVIGINNYAPEGSPGGNVWIGNGGQSSIWVSGDQGSYNISLGSNSLLRNTSGQTNVAIGAVALGSNTSGSDNLGLGYACLAYNTIGSYNTAIGRGALVFNISGNFNTGLGYNSLIYSTTGSFNLALGSESMYTNTSGSYNTAIGPYALYNNTTGTGNIALGSQSGSYTNGGGVNQISSNSVYIGGDTRASTSGNTNEVVIGYQARGNGSNTTTIGNSNTTHTVFQYGKTLVGYSAVQDRGSYALQVNGQIYATNAAIATSDARLKERIAPLSSGLKEVMALRPCTFDFKQGTEQNLATGRQVGFIAQEVASVLQDSEWASSVVQEAGGNLGIAETKLLPLLVKAVQEQQVQIEKLSTQLSLLQSQISQLERKAEAAKFSAKRVAHSK